MTEKNSIPLVDLCSQYNSIKTEIDNAISQVVSDGSFIRGRSVSLFEKKFAGYIGTEYCIGVGNGTDALELILQALNIGDGDEVIVPAVSWIATAEAVSNVGAEPIFADIKPDDYTIDPDDIVNKITEKTKAIIPVHLYGCPCDMDKISEIARKNSLHIVEDCAQAHGAEYKGQKIGTFGIASAFSFFPSKNLGAFGDAGGVVTDDKTIAEKVRMHANHGQLNVRHSHHVIGRNSRLDTLQAAILDVKLNHLDSWNEKRREAADEFNRILCNSHSYVLTHLVPEKKHVYHIYAVRCRFRDKLISQLESAGISSAIHYPNPLPFLEAYSYKNFGPADFPVAFHFCNEIVSLPIFPEISNDQIARICEILLENDGWNGL